jgi:hypothetical protein
LRCRRTGRCTGTTRAAIAAAAAAATGSQYQECHCCADLFHGDVPFERKMDEWTALPSEADSMPTLGNATRPQAPQLAHPSFNRGPVAITPDWTPDIHRAPHLQIALK